MRIVETRNRTTRGVGRVSHPWEGWSSFGDFGGLLWTCFRSDAEGVLRGCCRTESVRVGVRVGVWDRWARPARSQQAISQSVAEHFEVGPGVK